MKRTSTIASCVSLPSRRTTPSCSTRSNLACRGIVISVSSSKKSVLPLATSSNPALSRSAPVNAPLRYPNISDSSRLSGSAAQFRGTSFRAVRRLCWWMNCAIISLPVPLSPLIMTEASVAATFCASSTAFVKDGEIPSRASDSPAPFGVTTDGLLSFAILVVLALAAVCAARPIRTCRCEAEKGFGR